MIATGACSNPHVPAIAADLPDHIEQLTPIDYRNPGQLADGGVLVVGASASGLQIADELARAAARSRSPSATTSGCPRTYRGMDIHWWMDAIGQLDERYDEVDDLARARRLPSLQLVGTPERRDARPQRASPPRASSSSDGSSVATATERSSPGRSPTCARRPT